MTSGLITSGGGPEDGLYFHKSWSGGDDPGSHKVPQAYTMIKTSWMRGKTTYRFGTNEPQQAWAYNSLLDFPPAWTASNEIALLNKLSNKIRGHEFSASLAFAEPIKSYQTVRNSFKACLEIATYLKRGNYVGLSRALGRITGQAEPKDLRKAMRVGDVSGAYLAIRYGWEPLIKDAFAAAVAIEHHLAPPRTLSFKASDFVSKVWDDQASPEGPWPIHAVGKRTVRFKVMLAEDLSLMQSLDLVNPAAVIWENVPFSFVVDWFIPIGSYLSVRGLFTSSLKTSYVRSEFAEAKGDSLPTTTLTVPEILDQGYFRSRQCLLTRTVGTTIPVPLPSLKTVKEAMSLRHATNLAALILSGADSHARGRSPFGVNTNQYSE